MKKKGNIFVVSAPSGCGKTTIVERVMEEMPGIKRSVSATTRKPRPGEKNGTDYFFISEREFKDWVEKGKFLEWARTFGYYYGTPIHEAEKAVAGGDDLVLTIDVKGGAQVKKRLKKSVLIFIAPPDMKTLRERLMKRGTDSEKEIKKRLLVAEKEMARSKDYDFVVVNDDLGKAVAQIKDIIGSVRKK